MSNLVFLDLSDPDWMDLALAAPGANVFHHPHWLQVLAECYGYRPFIVAVRDGNGQLAAGLPMMEITSVVKRRRWVSLPFTDHCAPLYRDERSLAALRGGLDVLVQGNAAPPIELRSSLFLGTGTPSSEYALHSVATTDSWPQIVSRFHHTHRYDAEHARRKGVTITTGSSAEDMEAFYQLHLRTRRHHGVPVQPRRYFDLLRQGLLEQGLGRIVRAHYEGECIAAAVILNWRDTVTYKYSASDRSRLRVHPNHLIVESGIRWAFDNGYREFDMGRSDLDNGGLVRFKSLWGATETRLVYHNLPAQPASISENQMLAGALQSVIQRSPPWVCRATGELLYRYFG